MKEKHPHYLRLVQRDAAPDGDTSASDCGVYTLDVAGPRGEDVLVAVRDGRLAVWPPMLVSPDERATALGVLWQQLLHTGEAK